MTVFFGERWDAPILDDAREEPAPVDDCCYQCEHPIAEDDQGFIRPCFSAKGMRWRPIHRGCDRATTIGHLCGVCSCTGWDDIYERGQELVRRDDKGLLKPVGPKITA